MCSKEETAARIAAHLPEWNVSTAAEKAGKAALKQTAYVRETTEKLKGFRGALEQGLKALGCRVIPGEANFILFYSERELYEPLLERGILIRDCRSFAPMRDGGYYRVAVRLPEENKELLRAMEEIL